VSVGRFWGGGVCKLAKGKKNGFTARQMASNGESNSSQLSARVAAESVH